MRRISVLTTDNFLFQKIKLALLGRAEVRLGNAPCDVRIVDTDCGFEARPQDVKISRCGESDIRIPFAFSELDRLIDDDSPLLSISESERCAVLRGKAIKLTEVEYLLFSALMKRGGDFVTREEILHEVWGDDADSGVINVYIHYLREKLEGSGEKIIISSRKMGYKIDRKYLGGEDVCSE